MRKNYARRKTMNDNDVLLPEDYTDPKCPFCTEQYEKEPPVRSIPLDRVLGKLDEHLGANHYVEAERHLAYWLEEARAGRDKRGEFAIRNELMGLYRKRGRKNKAFENADAALKLIDEMQIQGSIGAGTAYVNAATVRKAFGNSEGALPLFEKAREIYEKELKEGDGRLGSLYNNMALSLVDLERYSEANDYYNKAIEVMGKVENGALEQAITCLNMANAAEIERGLEEAAEDIAKYLDKAEQLIETPTLPRNGYYAFVCDKCASTFGYYGRFFYEQELKERAKKIYEGA